MAKAFSNLVFACLLFISIGHQIADAWDCNYCIANPDAAFTLVKGKLDFVCGKRPDYCALVQPGGPCYVKGDVRAVASYVFNRWYTDGGECDFQGAEMQVLDNPSHGECKFKCRKVK